MLTKEQRIKNNKLRGTYKAYITVAKSMGYKFQLFDGLGGWHAGFFLGQNKIISLGKRHSLEEKVVILSHELGHAIDLVINVPKLEEAVLALKNWGLYIRGDMYYEREKAAWKLAETMLKQSDSFDVVSKRFRSMMLEGLLSYRQRKITDAQGKPA